MIGFGGERIPKRVIIIERTYTIRSGDNHEENQIR
jgi:hypothetical protein